MSSATQYLADALKALAQPTRLKIIDFLRGGERCVCEIFPSIDEEQSNTSRHLNQMQTHGILSRRKDGVKIYYAIKHPEVFEIIDLASAIVKREIELRSSLINNVEN
ncbi:MAG: metalloregulator ArsR/SmtB family transcription factor [Desulfuromonadaceae bacterium]|nr:metalloregulator ArsR/SmtB family transcription factor [Desulfuromonadaceae bacterium]MDD2855746.1 metalloregulator ArsR/SmtB family transcription factor [Desulfuromonadaceae bacterium]